MSIEETVRKMVKEQVKEEMERIYKPCKVRTNEWKVLSKEIDEFIDKCRASNPSYNPSKSGWIYAIHNTIKLALNLNDITVMTKQEVTIAREIFEKIKQTRYAYVSNVDVTSITSVHDKEGLQRLMNRNKQDEIQPYLLNK